MNTDLCKRIVREVYTGQKWFLLKNGTVMVLRDVPEATDEYVLTAMRKLADALGPYEGQGSSCGDCGTQKLRNFVFPCTTYVGADEINIRSQLPGTGKFGSAEILLEVQVAMLGRHKRNLDARNPEIIARSTDEA